MISIVFPTLNEEAYIGESIRALKSKMTLPYEIIVSDGKSTDKTVSIAKTAGADKVVEYKGTARQNIAINRNAGGAVAKGEFVVFMDADSRINDPDAHFTHALSHFEKDPSLVALTTRLKAYPGTETFGDHIIWNMMSFNLRMMNNVLHKGESTGKFQMIRKTAFDKLKGFREDLICREDADMFLRLSKIGKTYWDPHLTTFHSSRRAHKIGWVKLYWIWVVNTIWVILFNKAKVKEWTVIR